MDFLHRTWAEIDIDALKHNFEQIKSLCDGSEIMAVVKADAYGHSAKAVAPVLDSMGAASFAVSNIEEAFSLREIGIDKPILILGYTPPTLAKQLFENKITQTVFSYEYAQLLSQKAVELGVTLNVHIKLDTGMGRIGFDAKSDDGLSNVLKIFELENLEFEGIFTHFAVADEKDTDSVAFTQLQYNRFWNTVEYLSKHGHSFKYKHCCNSAGIAYAAQKHLDICRAGILLYGLKPNAQNELPLPFMPVMTVKSVISLVKDIKVGDSVGYGLTFTATKAMRVATVTAGYADGYPRKLSNKGYVLINGQKANIIGRISMDQMSVDVTHIDNVKMGDEVILFGKDLSVDVLAELTDTINYELICGISPRVTRVIINKGERK